MLVFSFIVKLVELRIIYVDGSERVYRVLKEKI